MSGTLWIEEPGTGRFYVNWRDEYGEVVRRYSEELSGGSSTSQPTYSTKPRSESNPGDSEYGAGTSRQPTSQRARRESISYSGAADPIDERPTRNQSVAENNESQSRNHSPGEHNQSRDGRIQNRSDRYASPPLPVSSRTSRQQNASGRTSTYDPAEDSLSQGFDSLTTDDVVGSPRHTVSGAAPVRHGHWGQMSSEHEAARVPIYEKDGETERSTGTRSPIHDMQSVQSPIHDVPSREYQDKGKGVAIGLPKASSSNPQGKRFIAGAPGAVEKLDKSYKVRNMDWQKFFQTGRVFSTLWTDAYAGTTNDSENEQFMSGVEHVINNERVRSKIRRFVVGKVGDRCCTCFPVTTYNGTGYCKRGIKLSEHGQIYSGDKEPARINGIDKHPLQVKLSKGAQKLHNSYINYGRPYTVECNVKVKDVGDLDSRSKKWLKVYYNQMSTASDDENGDSGPVGGPQARSVDLAGVGSVVAGSAFPLAPGPQSLNATYNEVHPPLRSGTPKGRGKVDQISRQETQDLDLLNPPQSTQYASKVTPSTHGTFSMSRSTDMEDVLLQRKVSQTESTSHMQDDFKAAVLPPIKRTLEETQAPLDSRTIYPSEWSELEWSTDHGCFSKYRLIGPGKQEINRASFSSHKSTENYEFVYKAQNVAEPRTLLSGPLPLDGISKSNDLYAPPEPEFQLSRSPTPVSHLSRTLQGTSSTPSQNQYQQPGATPGINKRQHIRTRDSSTSREELNENYRVHRAFEFKFGRVFKARWTEPKGEAYRGDNQGENNDSESEHSIRLGKHREGHYEKIRRFVVIHPRKGHCICLPILTYSGRGDNKRGVKLNDHTIIYTAKNPAAFPGEQEKGLTKTPIKVKPINSRHKLDPASRLNYAKTYTVEYNVKVWFIGEVVPESYQSLVTDFNRVRTPIPIRGSQAAVAGSSTMSSSFQGRESSLFPVRYSNLPTTSSFSRTSSAVAGMGRFSTSVGDSTESRSNHFPEISDQEDAIRESFKANGEGSMRIEDQFPSRSFMNAQNNDHKVRSGNIKADVSPPIKRTLEETQAPLNSLSEQAATAVDGAVQTASGSSIQHQNILMEALVGGIIGGHVYVSNKKANAKARIAATQEDRLKWEKEEALRKKDKKKSQDDSDESDEGEDEHASSSKPRINPTGSISFTRTAAIETRSSKTMGDLDKSEHAPASSSKSPINPTGSSYLRRPPESMKQFSKTMGDSKGKRNAAIDLTEFPSVPNTILFPNFPPAPTTSLTTKIPSNDGKSKVQDPRHEPNATNKLSNTAEKTKTSNMQKFEQNLQQEKQLSKKLEQRRRKIENRYQGTSLIAPEGQLDHRSRPTVPCAMLSDAKKPHGRGEEWIQWKHKFSEFRRQILPKPVDHENSQRVRVTVIDTGIDESHPYIQSKGWKPYDENAEKHLFCDFVQPNPHPQNSNDNRHDPVDDDGHGTFIAGILFQLAPDIELSVARIGATRESLKNDVKIGEKVARAIDHALEEWEAGIISMSFSCEEPSGEFRQAVKKALDRNVIVLAAAGNSGNRKLPYPAREKRVFTLFAANHFGYAAPFSPQITKPEQYHSYHVLGCDVVSTWPGKLRKEADEAELQLICQHSQSDHIHSENTCEYWTIMSGSSFSTPIAAALVAIIYQFYDEHKREIILREGIEDMFKTEQAVSAILAKMSHTGDQALYNFLEPTSGNKKFFEFQRHRGGEVNAQGQTYIQFFAQRLYEAINQSDI